MLVRVICPAQKVYQNREIQDLLPLSDHEIVRVGRDQLRETLFIKYRPEFQSKPALRKSRVHPLFACIRESEEYKRDVSSRSSEGL